LYIRDPCNPVPRIPGPYITDPYIPRFLITGLYAMDPYVPYQYIRGPYIPDPVTRLSFFRIFTRISVTNNNLFFRNNQIHEEIPVVQGDGRRQLPGEGQTGFGQIRAERAGTSQVAVVITFSPSQPSAVTVKSQAGDEKKINLFRGTEFPRPRLRDPENPRG
jgi:hypothetical protein